MVATTARPGASGGVRAEVRRNGEAQERTAGQADGRAGTGDSCSTRAS